MKSLQKALGLLETVVLSASPLSLKAAAAQRKLPMPTALRILKALREHGYVTRDPHTRLYAPGLRLWELGCIVVNRRDIVAAARPHLERLARVTGETVSLARYDRGDIVYLDKVNSPRPISMTLSVGERAPAHCVATGKAILAWRSQEDLSDILGAGIARFTRRTITSEHGFRRELRRIRANGCATNRGEYRDEVSGVAVPIFDHDGGVQFALGAAGPTHRFTRSKVLQIAQELRRSAVELSRALHASPAPDGEFQEASGCIPPRRELAARPRSARRRA